MPKLKGLDFLRTLQNPPLVIITTAYQEYAMEGYELNVIDYLLKPFSFERFFKAVQKAQDHKNLVALSKTATTNSPSVQTTTKTTSTERIFVKGDKKIHQIQLDAIQYLESLGSYVKIHLEDETIMTLDRLANFEKTLPTDQFLRVHKSFIVAISKIQTIEGNRLKIGETTIPIGNVYKQNLTKIIKR
jgi:DNA-binding LytR/AlgR family response regulator